MDGTDDPSTWLPALRQIGCAVADHGSLHGHTDAVLALLDEAERLAVQLRCAGDRLATVIREAERRRNASIAYAARSVP